VNDGIRHAEDHGDRDRRPYWIGASGWTNERQPSRRWQKRRPGQSVARSWSRFANTRLKANVTGVIVRSRDRRNLPAGNFAQSRSHVRLGQTQSAVNYATFGSGLRAFLIACTPVAGSQPHRWRSHRRRGVDRSCAPGRSAPWQPRDSVSGRDRSPSLVRRRGREDRRRGTR